MAENVSNLFLQHSEEMYDSEIYRHHLQTEYYNPYVLDTDIQAGESYLNIDFIFEQCLNFNCHLFYSVTMADI